MSSIIKFNIAYTASNATKAIRLPALFTENGLLISHLRFLYTKRNKSASWIERNTFAIQLLLNFINAHKESNISASKLLESFVDALNFGTIDSEKFDKLNLYWHPRRIADTNTLLSHINLYCDYIDEIHGRELPNLNPLRRSTNVEERIRWCAYYKRQSNCFLNHLNHPSPNRFIMSRSVQAPNSHTLSIESVSRFPEEHFERLLQYGFKKRRGEPDFGGILIVMLMHYGGIRLSECFHIYTHDITINNKTGSPSISVFHPSDGASPLPNFTNRRDYLNIQHRLKPRNEYHRSHRLFSGWKGSLLTTRNLSFSVMLFPNTKSIEFTSLLRDYLSVRVDGDHPYLFTNSQGQPESKKNFIKTYQKAIERIGLNSNKHQGTSPHSHRHSYGYRLAKSGFSQLEIQKAMHHKNPESCLVYIKPQDDEIREKMRNLNL
ncbi:site-specific integrase [Vibrio tarriae]|uniref:Site-specific integrase n=2 Tax=Vibrio TaxID=662 RepID=A0ABD7FZX5_9VIBR|nr:MULTISPECIES: gamma-mobile-trio recombinase GmtY [Vibrio]EJT3866035.1 site-specific integrase [Vibrio cholerae]QXC57700.1 site-specific integrase [Vibrio mimicus]RBM49255.1 site-specific integrase [Vibrio tarriae]RBM72214.1 site-specific integrase [Vibrio paracholerae]